MASASSDENAPASLTASYAAATQTLRSTAKWLLTAAAAVGGALIAGLQLTSIGALGLDQWPRLLLALVGVAIAAGSIGSIILRAGRLLTDDWINLAQLSLDEFQDHVDDSEDLKGIFEELAICKEELYGHVAEDIPGLYARLRELNLEDRLEPGTATSLAQDTASVRSAVSAVVQFANYYSARAKFNELNRYIVRAAIVAMAGVLIFAYAANPVPAETKPSTHSSTP